MKKLLPILFISLFSFTAHAERTGDAQQSKRAPNPALRQAMNECRQQAGLPERTAPRNGEKPQQQKPDAAKMKAFDECLKAKGFEKPKGSPRAKRAPDPAFNQARNECRQQAGLPERTASKKGERAQKPDAAKMKVFDECLQTKGFEKPKRPSRKTEKSS